MAKKKKIGEDEELLYNGDFPSLNSMLQKTSPELFKRNAVSLGFPTGFYPLDYRNGYLTTVYDDDDNIIKEYDNVGIFGGTFNTIIGKTGTAKTTLAAQMAVSISNYCLMKYKIPAEIYHIDAEQASNYTRIKNITGSSVSHLKKIYHINQELIYIEDIYEAIESIVKIKEKYKDTFIVDTDLLSEFDEPIRIFIPTIIIIDSLPSIANKEVGDDTGLMTSTYSNRLAKSISRFYKQCMPIVKKYNLIIFVINHINTKIEINPMRHTSPQTMYLKMDEALPGGMAPLYYAHNIFKIVVEEKLILENGGIVDGFNARVELLKSRSNKAGKSCNLIYDQSRGFDPYLSIYNYLKTECDDVILGKNPKKYIAGFEDAKFDERELRDVLDQRKDIKEALINIAIKKLRNILSKNKFNEFSPSISDVQLIYENLRESENL